MTDTPSPIEAPGTSEVSDERLRVLADMTKHYVTARMTMWDGEPVKSSEVASIARELLAARASTAPVAWPGEPQQQLLTKLASALFANREVRVTPLAWEWRDRDTLSRAHSILGTYKVWTHYEADGKWFWSLDGVTSPEVVASEGEGQVAAQADYETRIRSALTASIPDSGEGRVAELEKAARNIAPYLKFTIGPESPGHHPTMPSAVAAFLETVGDDALRSPPLPLPE